MQMRHPIRNILFVPLLALLLSACEILVVSAIVSSIDIAHDRRSIGEYIDDSSIELNINNKVIHTKENRQSYRVDATSWNGIVLLTGEVDTEQNKLNLIEHARNVQGVRQVVDETSIMDKASLGTRSNDTWLTTKTKSKLIRTMGTDANRIKVKTVRSTIYLMGIVTQEEAENATETARSIKGVERVVKVFEYQ